MVATKQVEKAVSSLLNHHNSKSNQNDKLFDDDAENFSVMVGFKSTPQLKKKPVVV